MSARSPSEEEGRRKDLMFDDERVTFDNF